MIENHFRLKATVSFVIFLFFCQPLSAEEKQESAFGVNKNQPISAGNYIYKNNFKERFIFQPNFTARPSNRLKAATYIYDGMDKNTLKIKVKTCPINEKTAGIQKPAQYAIDACTLNPETIELNPSREAVYKTWDGALLLIRVVDDAKRIAVSQLPSKSETDIDYGDKEQKN